MRAAATLAITVVGNSVTNTVRSPRVGRHEGTYVEELQKLLGPNACIVNRGGWSRIITEELVEFPHGLLNTFPDVVVVNFGINECAPRILPRRLWMLLHAEFYGSPFLKRMLDFVERRISRATPMLVKLTHAGGWMRAERFARHLGELLERIEKELRARVIVMNVGKPSDRVEAALPGVTHLVQDYNRAIAEVIARTGADLFDVYALVEAHGVDAIQPDGVHFNTRGHRLVAEELAMRIQRGDMVETEGGQRENFR